MTYDAYVNQLVIQAVKDVVIVWSALLLVGYTHAQYMRYIFPHKPERDQ